MKGMRVVNDVNRVRDRHRLTRDFPALLPTGPSALSSSLHTLCFDHTLSFDYTSLLCG